jgi:HEAT repeats
MTADREAQATAKRTISRETLPSEPLSGYHWRRPRASEVAALFFSPCVFLMSALALWRHFLGYETLHGESELCAALASVAELDLPERAAYLGFLPELVRDPNSRIRQAALKALAGAAGYGAIRLFQAALEDSDPDVRHAALEALRRSAAHVDAMPGSRPNPHARWGHALFHRSGDVRLQALDPEQPPAGPRWHRHLLVGDETPGVAESVSVGITFGAPEAEEIDAIFCQSQIGAVPLPLARRRLAATEPSVWSHWLERGWPLAFVLAFFAELSEDEEAERPTVRQRFAVNLARGAANVLTVPRRDELVRWMESTYAGRSWPDEFVRLAVAVAPYTLFETSLPLEQRRRATAVLLLEHATARGYPIPADTMRKLLASDLVRRPDDTPDLAVLGSLLLADPNDVYADLFATWSEFQLARAAAVDGAPVGPMRLLGQQSAADMRIALTRIPNLDPESTPAWHPTPAGAWGFSLPPARPEKTFEVPVPRKLTEAENDIVRKATDCLHDSPPYGALLSLRAALDLGPAVEAGLRSQIAQGYCAIQGPLDMVPLHLATELEPAMENQNLLSPYLLADLPREHLLPVVRGILLANCNGDSDEFKLLELLNNCPPDEPSVQASYGLVLAQGNCVNARREARQHMQRGLTRELRVSRLARAFAWGIRLGRVLTGQPFRIEMLVGEPLGYTRLKEDVLYITAMPILRGDANGDAIVRGLIVHEYGHHLYHKSPEALDVWADADEQNLGKLLNLVADEHLERNMRQRNVVFGEYLKLLNAYAFQRRTREIPLEMLLQRLGTDALGVLSQIKLGVAYDRTSIAVQNGKLLRLLDAGGNSFARFMRALRMGLGNRSRDPKVAEALKLFKGDFRDSDMARLFEIAKRLAEIFGDQIKLLDWMDQDASLTWSDHEAVSGEDDLNRNELNTVLSSLLGKQGGGERENDTGPRSPRGFGANLGPEAAFNRINNIVKLPHDPVAHAVYARKVAREAVLLRQSLKQLGLGMKPERFRTQGRRFDRGRANDLILKGDPRVLWARTPHRYTDLFLGVVVDCSGSMAGENMEKAKLFAALLAEAVRGLREVDLRIFGFTDRKIFDAGTASRCAAHGLYAHDGNNDAAALWHVYQEAQRSQRKAKLLVMISDGLPTECTVAALQRLVAYLSRRGYCCAQVAVAPLSQICFPHYVLLEPAALGLTVRKFAAVVTRLVQQALGKG